DIGGICGSVLHGVILSNNQTSSHTSNSDFSRSWRGHLQRKRRQSSDAREVHAVEQQGQLVLTDLDRGSVLVWPSVLASFQSLVPDRQAIAIPVDRLHAVSALTAEQVEMTGQRVRPERLGHDRTQSRKTATHVDRRHRHEDTRVRRELQHRSVASSLTTAGSTPIAISSETDMPL